MKRTDDTSAFINRLIAEEQVFMHTCYESEGQLEDLDSVELIGGRLAVFFYTGHYENARRTALIIDEESIVTQVTDDLFVVWSPRYPEGSSDGYILDTPFIYDFNLPQSSV